MSPAIQSLAFGFHESNRGGGGGGSGSDINYINGLKKVNIETEQVKFHDSIRTIEASSQLTTTSADHQTSAYSYRNIINNHDDMNDRENQNTLYQFEWPKMNDLTEIVSTSCSIAVIFGGLVPYIPQYLKIRNIENCDGFSTYVCLTLLLANLLRIMFWFGHPFELPLLIQSFVMIFGMLAMMEICIRMKKKNLLYNIPSNGDHRRIQRRQRQSQSIIGKLNPSQEDQGVERARGGDQEDDTSTCDTCEEVFDRRKDLTIEIEGDQHDGLDEENECWNSSILQSEDLNTPNLNLDSLDSQSETSETVLIASESQQSLATRLNANPAKSPQPDNLTVNVVSIDANESHVPYCQPSTSGSNTNQGTDTAEILSEPSTLLNTGNTHHHHHWLVKYINSCTRNFWQWDNYMSYVKFLALFTIPMSILTYILLDNELYIETLGFAAVLTESMIGIPQLIKNKQNRSTSGCSVYFIILWTSGDCFKTIYFLVKKTPAQFYICGSIQVIVDILILAQFAWYRESRLSYLRLPKEMTS